jgi:hypothetical protein
MGVTPTQHAIIGQYINGRNATDDFLQLATNYGGNVFGWIDSTGTLRGTLASGIGGGYSQVLPESLSFNAVVSAFHVVTTGSSTITCTLPTAVGNSTKIITIKKIDSGVGMVSVNGPVDGFALYDLVNQNQYLTVISDGTNWWNIGNN